MLFRILTYIEEISLIVWHISVLYRIYVCTSYSVAEQTNTLWTLHLKWTAYLKILSGISCSQTIEYKSFTLNLPDYIYGN
jgi:hypothetical protein